MDPSFPRNAPGEIKAPPTPPIPVSGDQRFIPEGAVADSLKFTREALELSFSPKFSLFLHGLEMLSRPKGGGMFSGLDQAIGGLMVLASPAWLAVRLAVGIPGIVIGPIMTGAAAVGTSCENLIRGASKKIQQSNAPSAAETQKKEIADAFVQRMHKTLENYSFMEQRFFKENPAQLIATCIVIIAFRARNLEGKSLYVQERIVKVEEFKGQDKDHEAYFKSICELKDALASLRLSPDEEHAWNYLTEAFKKVSTKDAVIENQSDEAKTLRFVMEKADELSNSIVKDPVFANAWQKSID